LLECHLDVGPASSRPSAWPIQPDENRIAAIVAGYTRWRRLQPAEKDLLPEGIRFPAAYVGAIHFEQAFLGGVRGRSMDVRLERLRNRLAVSGAVAEPPKPALSTRPDLRDEFQSEIKARVANFRAHQERFNREREAYCSATMARVHAALREGELPPRLDK